MRSLQRNIEKVRHFGISGKDNLKRNFKKNRCLTKAAVLFIIIGRNRLLQVQVRLFLDQ